MSTFEEEQAHLAFLMANCNNSESDEADALRNFMMETAYLCLSEIGDAFLEYLIDREYAAEDDSDSDSDSDTDDDSDDSEEDADPCANSDGDNYNYGCNCYMDAVVGRDNNSSDMY